MTIYSLRVTPKGLENSVAEEKLQKWLDKNSITRYLFCWEYGDKQGGLHMQGAIESDKKEQTIRVDFKREFKDLLKGNGSYSLKKTYKRKGSGSLFPCDEKLYWYCCKGTDRTAYTTAILSDDHAAVTDEYNCNWWDMIETVEDIKVQNKNESEEAKENQYRDWLKKMYPQKTIEGDIHYHNTTKEYVYDQLLDIFVEKNLILSEIKFKNAFCYILSRVNPPAYREFLHHCLKNKILYDNI